MIVCLLKSVYMAPSEQAAKDRFEEFAMSGISCLSSSDAAFGQRTSLFLQCDARDPPGGLPTNAIESINARYRRAIRARRYYPKQGCGTEALCIS